MPPCSDDTLYLVSMLAAPVESKYVDKIRDAYQGIKNIRITQNVGQRIIKYVRNNKWYREYFRIKNESMKNYIYI